MTNTEQVKNKVMKTVQDKVMKFLQKEILRPKDYSTFINAWTIMLIFMKYINN